VGGLPLKLSPEEVTLALQAGAASACNKDELGDAEVYVNMSSRSYVDVLLQQQLMLQQQKQ
jgi:hypothetical protein